MPLTHAHPSMVNPVFENWEQAEMATIPAGQEFILVAGRTFQRWTGSSGLSLFTTNLGTKMWAPPIEDIRLMHFLRAGLSHQTVVERAIAWAAAYAATVPIVTSADRIFGLPVVIDARTPMQLQMTGKINLTANNFGLSFLHGNFKMIAGAWVDADPYANWIFHSYSAGGMTAVQVENATRDQFYRCRKSDYLFNCLGSASRVNFINTKIDCGQKGGGIMLAANCTAHMVQIDGCAGYGLSNIGGGATASECYVTQWNIGDPEYYDKDAYTGIGIFSENSDFYIQNCRVSWLKELGRFERTNSIVRDGHWFNGMQQYNAADRLDISAAANQAIFDYFMAKGNPYGWLSPANTLTQNFTPRDKHVGITTASRRDQADYEADATVSPVSVVANIRQDISIQNIYPDNCHFDFYCNGWTMTAPSFGLKKTSSLAAGIAALIRPFAPAAGAQPRFRLDLAHPLVESVNSGPSPLNKHFIEMRAGLFGETWQGNYAAYNADETRNWISTINGARGLGYSVGSDTIDVTLQADVNPNKTVHTPGTGSFLGYSDGTSTAAMLAGTVGDEFQVKQAGGAIGIAVTAAGQIRTPALPVYASNAAAVAGGLAVNKWYQTATGELRIRI